MEYSSKTERSMMRAMCGEQLNDRKVYGENNVWSTAQG